MLSDTFLTDRWQQATMLGRLRAMAVATAAFYLVLAIGSQLAGCPLCGSPGPPLSSKIANADHVILAQWVQSSPRSLDKAGSTQYQVVQILKSTGDNFAAGEPVVVPEEVTSEPGNLYLLFARQSSDDPSQRLWQPAVEISETGYNYLRQAPSTEAPIRKRLTYYKQFLEFSDKTISDDAFAEFAQAPFPDVVDLADQFSRTQLRAWISQKETPPARVSFYGMVLGLCGNKEDARFLAELIFLDPAERRPLPEERLGVEGLIAGYLWLTRDDGLSRVDEQLLKDPQVPQTDAYAVMQSLRFIWSYSNERISPARLKQSMQLFLDRPELAAMAVADLARWRDWSVAEKLKSRYADESFGTPTVRRNLKLAIISYFSIVSSSSDEIPPATKDDANQFLKMAEKESPRLYRQATRYTNPQDNS